MLQFPGGRFCSVYSLVAAQEEAGTQPCCHCGCPSERGVTLENFVLIAANNFEGDTGNNPIFSGNGVVEAHRKLVGVRRLKSLNNFAHLQGMQALLMKVLMVMSTMVFLRLRSSVGARGNVVMDPCAVKSTNFQSYASTAADMLILVILVAKADAVQVLNTTSSAADIDTVRRQLRELFPFAAVSLSDWRSCTNSFPALLLLV